MKSKIHKKLHFTTNGINSLSMFSESEGSQVLSDLSDSSCCSALTSPATKQQSW